MARLIDLLAAGVTECIKTEGWDANGERHYRWDGTNLYRIGSGGRSCATMSTISPKSLFSEGWKPLLK